jgi:hypothetical protein
MLDLLASVAPSRPTAGVGALLPQALGLPSEWRIAAIVVIGVALALRPVPFAIRHLSRGVELVASGLVSVGLYGEYAFTRWRASAGAPPHPLVYEVDRWLEAAFGAVRATCAAAAAVLGKRRRLRWQWWSVVVAIALAPAVITLLASQPGAPSSVLALAGTTEAVWRPVDGWVMTGRLRAVPASIPAAACPASPGARPGG